jgi:DNA-binding NtrC family response regulator
MRRLLWDTSVKDPTDNQGKAKVLLIDDDSTDLEYLFRILDAQGHEVTSCTSYHLGARLVESGTFDFVVVSQGSRAFEGRVVIERARELEPRPVVVVVARIADMNCYLEAMQLGVADYLEKPVPPMEMQRIITATRGDGYFPEP